MRVFVARTFVRWASREGIADEALLKAAFETVEGRHEADLGGLLFKKRIARAGGGKSGGYRTIIGFRKGASEKVVFLYGFAKNDRENLLETEMRALAKLARTFFDAEEDALAALVARRVFGELVVGQ